jgi:hypothetical protein
VLYALVGFAGVLFAALLGLLGVLRAGRPQQQQADMEGLRALLDEIRADRDDQRRIAAERRDRIRELAADQDRLTAELARTQAELVRVTAELAAERALSRADGGKTDRADGA